MGYNKLFIADNLDILPRLRRGLFDVIYLDPPFNTEKVFRYLGSARHSGGGFVGEEAFKDVWEWNDECERIVAAWSADGHSHNELFRYVGLFDARKEARLRAYLTNMAVRLALMRPLLKPRGSIWLHCDHTASHYIRVLMDRVFGRGRFVNEIIWHYKNASRGKKRLAHSHDVIFGYGAAPEFYFNREAVLAPFESGMTAWRHKKRGQKPPEGKTPDDVVVIPALNTMDSERTGYATQKPRVLLDFLLKAFCPPGGIVLDPFCGCGTTIDAAVHSGRQFVGVDVNPDVKEFIKKRRDGDLLLQQIDTIEWGKLFEDAREFDMQASEADENRAAEIRVAEKMNGAITPASGDGGVDVNLPGVVVSVKNGLSVQLNALREIEGAASRRGKKGVLVLTRRGVPASWRKYADESGGKIAVVSEADLDSGDMPPWLLAAIRGGGAVK
ncbi:MAG: DNA methyltransferase [Gammaproteobacteria bacterium]